MTRKRRLIVGILVATIALGGVLVGSISADDEVTVSPRANLMARVAQILGIDQEDVENAFQQALTEQRDARLQDLVDQGVLTEEQVAEWKAWCAARPDNRDELRAWFASRPDMGDSFASMRPGRSDVAGSLGPRAMMPGGLTHWGKGFAGACPAFGAAE